MSVFGAGCSSSPVTVPGSGQVDLKALRSSTEPRYWLGKDFAGLPITHADGAGLVVYGTCEIPTGPFGADGGCAPPIQIQHWRFKPKQWRNAANCVRLPSLRGVPTARHDGLVLFTRHGFVKIYARNHAEDVRVANALQPVAGGHVEHLPPPDRDIVRAVRDACGA
jgi:hypothetical protein